MKLDAFDKTPAQPLAVQNVQQQQEMNLKNFGEKEMREALDLLERYRKGKSALDARIVEENLWWQRRHAGTIKKDDNGKVNREPAGAQLFNAIENKIADICDNIPECAFLARSKDDEETADMLTSVMPALLEENELEAAFADVTRDKVSEGTGIYAVTWDESKRNGLGDVSIRNTSPLNLFWEPKIKNIQDSPALFYVNFVSNDVIKSEYPALSEELLGRSVIVEEKHGEDAADDSHRTAVIDYYYKRKVGKRTILHFAKICSNHILYASENDPECIENGWYNHGRYPFEFDVMFPLPNSPCGIGYINVGKDQQYQIDRLNNSIVRNAVIASARRKYIREDADIDEKELMDIENDVVKVGGSRDIREMVMAIEEPPLSGNYISVLQNLEEGLKEVTANRDFSNGGTAGGVTSGTAISALVEAGNKQSRMVIRGSYEAYKRVVTLCFELYRQFGDTERFVRIKGEDGSTQYKTFSNAAFKGVPQVVAGEDMGLKEPVFDIMVRPHKKSPFARVTQNTMMQEFYGAGFFAPENATQALACLDGMEFDGKDALCRRIEQNGTIYTENLQLKQAMLRLAGIIDMNLGENLTAEIAADFGLDVSAVQTAGQIDPAGVAEPDIMKAQTDPRMQKAAEQIAESTSV